MFCAALFRHDMRTVLLLENYGELENNIKK